MGKLWTMEECGEWYASRYRTWDVKLLGLLKGLEERYEVAWLQGGESTHESNASPCWTFRLGHQGKDCIPVGAKSAVLFADFLTDHSGVKKLSPRLAKDYRQMLQAVSSGAQKCPNIRVATRDDLEIVCRAVEWLTQQMAQLTPRSTG